MCGIFLTWLSYAVPNNYFLKRKRETHFKFTWDFSENYSSMRILFDIKGLQLNRICLIVGSMYPKVCIKREAGLSEFFIFFWNQFYRVK